MMDLDASPDDGECRRCGSAVSEQFRKVFGSDDDVAHGCIECMTLSDLCDGLAATPGDDAAQRGDARVA